MAYTKADIKRELLKSAHSGNRIYYSTLCSKLSIPNQGGYGSKFYRLLEKIGHEELKANRPLLNSIVVAKMDNRPGSGFFKWYRKNIKDASSKLSDGDLAKLCIKKCIDHWSAINEDELEQFV